ncbi:Uncharacterised protein [uncultured archaeon]|nr:Uncharacterised protein [uncultured archaeon]
MKGKNILLSIFLVTILLTLVVAENNSSTDLQKFYNNAQCKVDFYSSVITSMNSLVASDAVNSAYTTIQSDLSQIQNYSYSGDRAALRQFKNTFESDNSALKTAISDWKKENVKNLSKVEKLDLLSQFNQLRTTYDACYVSSLKDFGNGRINYFNNNLEVYQKKIDALSAKGVDVSSLNNIITDAQTQIIAPLQTIIDSATTADSLNQAVKQYCLFDGCTNGINFHLTAKFEIAKLQIALNAMTAADISQDKTDQLYKDITNANMVLAQVGTKVYDSSQKKNIWNLIKDGQSIVKSILNTSKSTQPENMTVNLTQ